MVDGVKAATKPDEGFGRTCPTCLEKFDYKIDPKSIDTVDFKGFDGTVCVNTFWFIHDPGFGGK